MANTIFSSEGALLFIMVATVALGFWLQRFKVFKTLGPALTVIVMGIVMSNLRIVPTSSPTYDAISGYCVPLSVSICLLSLDLKQMRKLSKEPIIALASAIFSVCVAALVFGVLFANKIDEGWKVAGMFVGTYTGGSSNLTAIAVGLDASKNTIASANAADYVVGIPTLILMFATPALYKSSKWLKKLWPYEMSESELLGDGNHEELMTSKEWSIMVHPGNRLAAGHRLWHRVGCHQHLLDGIRSRVPQCRPHPAHHHLLHHPGTGAGCPQAARQF